MESNEGVEILFEFYSDILDQEMKETMWAIPIDIDLGRYQLDSLPFYIPNVATDDLVRAEWDDEKNMLVYRETLVPSGNSIIWVAITKEGADVDEIMDLFFELGCISEAASNRYFAMEVKASVNYLLVKDQLRQLRSLGTIDFFEGCLSYAHNY